MKVILGDYNKWYSPHKLIRPLKKFMSHDRAVEWTEWFEDTRLGTWLASKNHNSIRKEYVRIDEWDTWDMQTTLGKIALPMLKQMRSNIRGAGHVDNKDVPEELRRPEGLDDWVTDDNHFKRWEYILDEMIHAFENLLDDAWEQSYRTGNLLYRWGPADEYGNREMIFDRSNYHVDYEGLQREWDRIDRGLLMFGKYYRNLWD